MCIYIHMHLFCYAFPTYHESWFKAFNHVGRCVALLTLNDSWQICCWLVYCVMSSVAWLPKSRRGLLVCLDWNFNWNSKPENFESMTIWCRKTSVRSSCRNKMNYLVFSKSPGSFLNNAFWFGLGILLQSIHSPPNLLAHLPVFSSAPISDV